MPRVYRIVDVRAPVDRCFELWSRFEDFPRFIEQVQEVHRTGSGTYHWVARAPSGQEYEWDTRVLQRQDGRVISWESISGVGCSGTVRFEPGDGGCRAHVWLELTLPGEHAGETFAKVSGDAEARADQVLRNFKELAEGSRSRRSRTR